MRTDDPLIELDVSQPWQPPEERAVRLVPPRGLVAAVLAVLLAVGLPPPADVRPAWGAPLLTLGGTTGELKIGGDLMYVLDEPVGGRNGLRAYDLTGDTGFALWRVDIEGGIWSWHADSDVSIFTADLQRDRDTSYPVTTAVRGRTGGVSWRVEGFQVEALLTDVAVLRQFAPATETDEDPPAEVELRGVDRLTGALVWTRRVPVSTTWVEQRDPLNHRPTGRVVEFAYDGLIRVIDPRSGTEVSRARIDIDNPIGGVFFEEDLLVVSQGTPTGPVLSGYDVTTGLLRWSAIGRGTAMPCGRYTCDIDADAGMLTVTDTATGVEQWRRPVGDLVTVAGDRIVVTYQWPAAVAGTHVVELASGRSLQHFPRWHIVDTVIRGRALVAQNRGGLFTLGIADLDRGGVVVLARAEGWFSSASCRVSGAYVGCYGGTSVAVWRLADGVARTGTAF